MQKKIIFNEEVSLQHYLYTNENKAEITKKILSYEKDHIHFELLIDKKMRNKEIRNGNLLKDLFEIIKKNQKTYWRLIAFQKKNNENKNILFSFQVNMKEGKNYQILNDSGNIILLVIMGIAKNFCIEYILRNEKIAIKEENDLFFLEKNKNSHIPYYFTDIFFLCEKEEENCMDYVLCIPFKKKRKYTGQDLYISPSTPFFSVPKKISQMFISHSFSEIEKEEYLRKASLNNVRHKIEVLLESDIRKIITNLSFLSCFSSLPSTPLSINKIFSLLSENNYKEKILELYPHSSILYLPLTIFISIFFFVLKKIFKPFDIKKDFIFGNKIQESMKFLYVHFKTYGFISKSLDFNYQELLDDISVLFPINIYPFLLVFITFLEESMNGDSNFFLFFLLFLIS